jgi:hypothetical protein
LEDLDDDTGAASQDVLKLHGFGPEMRAVLGVDFAGPPRVR